MLDMEPDGGRDGCLLSLGCCCFFWAGVLLVIWWAFL